ncbi:MAG: YDG domain-containing protein [Firmicutes bacterium]|nr:YDG domain-containing protein [Bacillota bacterium]
MRTQTHTQTRKSGALTVVFAVLLSALMALAVLSSLSAAPKAAKADFNPAEKIVGSAIGTSLGTGEGTLTHHAGLALDEKLSVEQDTFHGKADAYKFVGNYTKMTGYNDIIKFAEPLNTSEISGVVVTIWTEYGLFQNNYGDRHGIRIYGLDATGEGNPGQPGYMIPMESVCFWRGDSNGYAMSYGVLNTPEWIQCYVPKAKITDANDPAKITGLQFSFDSKDAAGFGNDPANCNFMYIADIAPYVTAAELSLKMLDTRLDPVIGIETPYSLSLTTEAGAGTLETHANVPDGCETPGYAYRTAMTQETVDGMPNVIKFENPVKGSWATVVTTNAIKFAEPIIIANLDDMGLTFKIKSDRSYLDGGWYDYYMYGKGEICPVELTQWQLRGLTGYRIEGKDNLGWVLMQIPKSDLHKIADSDDPTKISMVQFGMGQIAAPDMTLYIAEIGPTAFIGLSSNLIKNGGTDAFGIDRKAIGMTAGSADTVNDQVYKMSFNSWATTLSSNVIAFEAPIHKSQIVSLTLRVYAHFSAGSTFYNDGGYGPRLYGADSTGVGPVNVEWYAGYEFDPAITQDQWIDLSIPIGEIDRVFADADGYLRGLQFGCLMASDDDNTWWVGGTAAYLAIDYIAVVLKQDTLAITNNLNGITYGDAAVTLATSGGSGAGAVSYQVVSGPASVAGDQLTFTGAGEVKIKALKDLSPGYIAAESAEVTFTVAQKALTLEGFGVEGRDYNDGTGITLATGWEVLTGVVNSDDVSVVTAGVTASIANADVGTGKAVTVSSIGLTGAKAGNYTLAQPTGVTVDIGKFNSNAVTWSTEPSASLAYGISFDGVASAAYGTVAYQYSDDEGATWEALTGTLLIGYLPEGVYQVKAVVEGTSNYNGGESLVKDFEVTRATLIWADWFSLAGFEYAYTGAVVGGFADAAEGELEYTFAVKGGSALPGEPVDAGEYTVTAAIKDTAWEITTDFTVTQAANSVEWTGTPANKVYDGDALDLTGFAAADFGAVDYIISFMGEDGWEVVSEIKERGRYAVTLSVTATDNYAGATDSSEVTVYVTYAVNAINATVTGVAVEGMALVFTAAAAPTGKEFDCFEVNGVKIDGNVYTVGTEDIEVEAIYKDSAVVAYTITVTDDAATYAGTPTPGSTITLTAGEAPEGKVFDYFKVNGEKITGSTFAMPAADVTVEVVWKDESSGGCGASGGSGITGIAALFAFAALLVLFAATAKKRQTQE